MLHYYIACSDWRERRKEKENTIANVIILRAMSTKHIYPFLSPKNNLRWNMSVIKYLKNERKILHKIDLLVKRRHFLLVVHSSPIFLSSTVELWANLTLPICGSRLRENPGGPPRLLGKALIAKYFSKVSCGWDFINLPRSTLVCWPIYHDAFI